MVLRDKNFDAFADRLSNTIYGSAKGKLRLELVSEDIFQELAQFNGKNRLRILDAGGGQGQISLKLAELGHTIVLCDISKVMLHEAEKRFQAAGLLSQLKIINQPFQTLQKNATGMFDIIMVHAVLEWLAEPQQSLADILPFVKPDGFMSLLFYNLNALIHQNAIKGNFRKLLSETYTGDCGGITPYHPLGPDRVKLWLKNEGFRVQKTTGVRVFYDYMNKEKRNQRSFKDIMTIEKKYCRTEPYASLGKYMHYIVRHI